MRLFLTPFLLNHHELLRRWFDGNAPGSSYIEFYSKPAQWSKLIDGQNRFGFIATNQDRVPCGFADIEILPNHGANIAFGIDPNLRRKGYGRKLLESIEEFCLKQDIHVIRAYVDIHNSGCRNLMNRNGYNEGPTENSMTVYSKILP